MKRHLIPWLFLLCALAALGCSSDGSGRNPADACMLGEQYCEDGCVNTSTNASHCGSCGNICPAGSICLSGSCTGDGAATGTGGTTGTAPGVGGATTALCTAPLIDCSGVCVDPTADPGNCGACGAVCAADQVCAGGGCCAAGQNFCGICTDILSDKANCGACGNPCWGDTFCYQGQCIADPGCTGLTKNCGGVCVSISSDINNCGDCNVVCGAGLVCISEVCSPPPTCPEGQTACGAVCTNLTNDNNNCGTCNIACPGGTSCINSVCTAATTVVCTAPMLDCGGTTCFDSLTSNAHCGTCGVACAGGMTCQAGVCACPAGQQDCDLDGVCDALDTVANCGTCGTACGIGQACEAGVCACPATAPDCNADGVCDDLASDPTNCGACGTVCAASEVCSESLCTTTCAAGLENCSGSCVALGTSANCAACGDVCDAAAGQSCVAGVCSTSTTLVCEAPLLDCGGTECVDSNTDAGNCGVCGNLCEGGTTCVGGVCSCPAGEELCGVACVAAGTCTDCSTTSPGMISNFENLALTVIAQPGEDWTGTWETFQEAAAGPPLAIEATTTPEGTCGGNALHTSGSDFGGWVGIDVTLRGTDHNAAIEYDGSKWTGIRFWAKGSATNTPVRFNISTAWTEGAGSGGECVEGSANDWELCYNHVGRFLYDLGAEWKQYTFCFDRDLYPLFIPGYLDAEQRKNVASRILKLQWQFNNAKDLSTLDPTTVADAAEFPKYAPNSPFELWLDDVEFFDGACPEPEITGFDGAAAFPQNATAFGSCATPENASVFNGAILEAYNTWITNLVTDEGGGKRVMSPEHGSSPWGTPSEAMGYGMMIAAAMGDQALFDAFWAYTQSELEGTGLMRWLPSSSGSATDADADIAYSLLMADAQWGGDTYATAAGNMIAAMYVEDVTDGNVNVGSNDWANGAFNASYFTPSFYDAFGGSWGTVKSNGYGVLSANQAAFGNGLFSDWSQTNGTPIDGNSIGAQVTGGFSGPVYGYDAARVPWRIGMDACANGESSATAILGPMLDFFSSYSTHQGGDRIDLLLAGWQNGQPASTAVPNQMSFIGPVGVGAMAVPAAGGGEPPYANMRDMAFRSILDIIENPEYNQTYYPTTLGLITLLTMTGNLPHP